MEVGIVRRGAFRGSMLPAALGLGLAACGGTAGGGTNGGGGTVSLTLQNFSFQPNTIQATPGSNETVTLHNTDSVKHNFTIKALSVDTDIGPGETKTVSFTPSGSTNLQFYCEYHHLTNNMVGVVNLGGSNTVGSGSNSGGSTPSSSSTYGGY